MNKEKLLGIIRHVLTIAGTLAVAYGYTDDATFATISGGILTLVSVVWSALTPEKSEEVVNAAKAQGFLGGYK